MPEKLRGRLGIVLLSVLALLALAAGLVSPHNPWVRFTPFLSPGFDHLLGTNDLGNDILSELIYGLRTALIVGAGAAILSTILGLTAGLLAGTMGGVVDGMLMAAVDIFLTLPRIPLIIVLAAFFLPSVWTITMILGLLWWPATARLVRSKTLQLRESAFVASARCLGFGTWHIITAEMLPHLLRLVLPRFLMTFASAMIAEASLSFLGLGDTLVKSWGTMLSHAFRQGGLINGLWWWILPPGVCLVMVSLSLVLIGFYLEENAAGSAAPTTAWRRK